MIFYKYTYILDFILTWARQCSLNACSAQRESERSIAKCNLVVIGKRVNVGQRSRRVLLGTITRFGGNSLHQFADGCVWKRANSVFVFLEI